MTDIAQPTPRNSYLGWLADKVGATKDFLNQSGPGNRPGSSGNTMHIGDALGLGAVGNVLNNASYGDSPFAPSSQNVTNGILPTFKTGRYADIRDAAMAAAPFAGPLARVAGPIARTAIEEGGLSLAQKGVQALYDSGPKRQFNPSINQEGAIKLKGGNWETTSSPLHDTSLNNYLYNISRHRSEHSQDWANTTLEKYIKNKMGTKEDPLFNVENKHLPSDEMINNFADNTNPNSVKHHLDDNSNNHWENLSDSSINQYNVGSIDKNSDNYQSWMSGVNPDIVVNKLNLSNSSYDKLGFDKMLKHIDSKLNSGELSPEDLKRSPVELISKQMGDARVEKENYVPPQPTEITKFPNGNSLVKLDKPGQFADESDRMGHSVRGYEPTDNTLGAGEGGYDKYGTGTGGYGSIQNGTSRVLSLRDPKGKSLATIESTHPDAVTRFKDLSDDNQNKIIGPNISNYDRQINANYPVTQNPDNSWSMNTDNLLPANSKVTQIKGPRNNPVDPQNVPDIIDHLNTHHANDDVNLSDLTDNGIIDTKDFPSLWSHEPKFLDTLNQKTNNARFVDNNTVRKTYGEIANDESSLTPSEVQDNIATGFTDPHNDWEPE
jgi:hypothetical protein